MSVNLSTCAGCKLLQDQTRLEGIIPPEFQILEEECFSKVLSGDKFALLHFPKWASCPACCSLGPSCAEHPIASWRNPIMGGPQYGPLWPDFVYGT